MTYRGNIFKPLDPLGCIELRSPISHSLLSLILGRREDNHLAASLGGELDRQMAQTAEADNTDPVGGLDIEHVQDVENRGAAAHES